MTKDLLRIVTMNCYLYSLLRVGAVLQQRIRLLRCVPSIHRFHDRCRHRAVRVGSRCFAGRSDVLVGSRLWSERNSDRQFRFGVCQCDNRRQFHGEHGGTLHYRWGGAEWLREQQLLDYSSARTCCQFHFHVRHLPISERWNHVTS